MKNKKIINVTLISILILIVISVLLLAGKTTQSFMGPDEDDDVIIPGEVTASDDKLIFSKTKDISLKATTDNFSGTNNLTDTTTSSVKLIANSKTNKADATYNVYAYIRNNTFKYSSGETPELLLTIKKNGAVVNTAKDLVYKTQGSVSGFDITIKNGLLPIRLDEPIVTNSSSTGKTDNWEFTLTFVNLGTNIDQSINESAELDIELIVQKDKYVTAAETIISTVPIVTSGTGLYHHDSTLNLGANDGSYRYAGKNPNNYICIGKPAPNSAEETEYNVCATGTDNKYMYRIIGVFDGQLKVIKDSPIKDSSGNIKNLVWDSNHSNVWKNSTLKKGLNGETGGKAIALEYYNTVLKSLVEGKIIDSSAKWYIDGYTTSEITPKEMHDAEIKGTTITAPIGLMYAHDYGYASSGGWDKQLYNYEPNLEINWLGGITEWIITRYYSNSKRAFFVDSSGFVDGYGDVATWYEVRPVYYLVSDIKISNGDGSLASPYQI